MTQPENNNWQVESYRQRWDVELLDSLGAGIQGNVFSAISPRHRYVFAVKFHRREVAFYRELTVYRRIQELEINEVCGHQVPQLLAHDTELFVLEMTIVTPGRLHGDLPTENNLLHVAVVPAGVEPLVLHPTLR